MTSPGGQRGAPAPTGIAGVFDRVAETYDAVGVSWFTPIAAGLVQALAPQPAERALDVGCGKGAALLPLARAVGPGGHVLGLDLAPRMVAAAREAADSAHLTNVEVRVADAAAPPDDGSRYDLVCSSLVLFFMADPGAALRVWAALLRVGGRLGIATFGTNDPVIDEVDAVFTPYLPQHMKDARTSGRRGPFSSDAGVERLFVDAGLEHVQTSTPVFETVLRDVDQWHEWTWSHGQRVMWEHVPLDRREQVRRQAYALLAPHQREDGSLLLRQQLRYTLGVRSAASVPAASVPAASVPAASVPAESVPG